MFCFLLLLIAAIAICSWLSPPGSSLNRAAWQALDSTVAALSQGDEEDEGDDDDVVRMPERMPQALGQSLRAQVRAASLQGGSASHHFRRSVLLRARSGAVPCVASY